MFTLNDRAVIATVLSVSFIATDGFLHSSFFSDYRVAPVLCVLIYLFILCVHRK